MKNRIPAYEPIEPKENLVLAAQAACLLIEDMCEVLGFDPTNCQTLDRLVEAIELIEAESIIKEGGSKMKEFQLKYQVKGWNFETSGVYSRIADDLISADLGLRNELRQFFGHNAEINIQPAGLR